jgi:hypothetical protein
MRKSDAPPMGEFSTGDPFLGQIWQLFLVGVELLGLQLLAPL